MAINPKASAAKKNQQQGLLQEHPLETILFSLADKGANAQVVLERENNQKRLLFLEGRIIFASSTLEKENLFQYLRQQGVLSFEQIKAISDKDAKSPVPGWAITQTRDLDGKVLAQHLENYVTNLAISAFAWHSGHFSLNALPSLPKFEWPAINPVSIIFNGIKQHYQFDLLGEKFGKIQDRILIFTPEFKKHYAEFQFKNAEQRFLTRIDGKQPIGALVGNPDLTALETLQFIWALFSVRMLGMAMTEAQRRVLETERLREEAEKKARTEKPKEKEEAPLDPQKVRREMEDKYQVFAKENFFQTLNVDRKANQGQIYKSYMSLAKRFHPDVMIVLGLTDLNKKSGEIFAKMTQAYETLNDVKRRKEYEASLDIDPATLARLNDIVQAESEFLKGESMLKSRMYDTALKQFEKALSLNPEEAEHHVFLAWTKYLLEQKNDKEAASDQAKKAIRKALGMRNNMDMAHVFLGQIAKAAGNIREAQECFNKAVEINPKNEQAQTEIKVLLMKK